MMCASTWLHKIALILPVLVVAFAEPALPEPSSKAPAKTTITSQRMTVRNKDHQAVFEGKVELKKVLARGSLIVRSDVMIVFYTPPPPDRSEKAPGSQQSEPPSQNKNVSVSRIEATGDVKIEKEDGRATCGKAVYYQDQQKIVLTGNPVAWQKGNRVTGKTITMFLDDDRTIVEGGTRLMLEDAAGVP